MAGRIKNCKMCRNETLCRAWFRELVEESYTETGVTIYTRFIINGDGCECFISIEDEN